MRAKYRFVFAVQPCNLAAHTMNVTLKLPDELCKKARHRAVDESKSLSAWLTDLIKRELQPQPKGRRKTLAELLGDPATADRDFELPDRKRETEREMNFR